MVALASVDVRRLRRLPLFVHLTYPGEYSTDDRRWKRDLDAFTKALLRRYPEASAHWRIEAQKRGAPHYHLIVYGVEYIPHKWVAETWYRIVGSGDVRHLAAGSRVERVRSPSQVVIYAAKYISKTNSTELRGVGRHWGTLRRRCLPVTWLIVALTLEEFTFIRRTLNRYLKSCGYRRRPRDGLAGGYWFLGYQTAKRILDAA